MSGAYKLTLSGAVLQARGSGTLWWPAESLLVVSDLHLGKSERLARKGGALLPPFEALDTLARLEAEVAACAPECVICLGDSFDDPEVAAALPDAVEAGLLRLMAGRHWIWIEGNHDPGPVGLGGTHLAELVLGPLAFRHIADPDATGEVSGHYHPKARLAGRGRGISRRCFLQDTARIILPAFGTYTGGLRSTAPELAGLMQPDALAVLCGDVARAIPMPGRRPAG